MIDEKPITSELETVLSKEAKRYRAHLYWDGRAYVLHRQGYDWALFFRPTGNTCSFSRRWHEPFAVHDWII